jgi:hypothetical protein
VDIAASSTAGSSIGASIVVDIAASIAASTAGSDERAMVMRAARTNGAVCRRTARGRACAHIRELVVTPDLD